MAVGDSVQNYWAQRLEDKKLLGYVTSDLNQVDNLVIKQGKAAFAKIEKFKIKERGEFGLVTEYFEMEDWRAEAYEKISKKLSELEQVCIKECYLELDNRHSGTELVCLENWYKDTKKEIAVRWEESYILNKEGYYKSYDGYPKVYGLEDAVRGLELKKKDMKLLKRSLISLVSAILSPFIGMAAERFVGGSYTLLTVGGTLGLASFSYFIKIVSDKAKLDKKIWSIEPLFEGNEAINKLKKLYSI